MSAGLHKTYRTADVGIEHPVEYETGETWREVAAYCACGWEHGPTLLSHCKVEYRRHVARCARLTHYTTSELRQELAARKNSV